MFANAMGPARCCAAGGDSFAVPVVACAGPFSAAATGPGGSAVDATDGPGGVITVDASDGPGTYTVTISAPGSYSRTVTVVYPPSGPVPTVYLPPTTVDAYVFFNCGTYPDPGPPNSGVSTLPPEDTTIALSGGYTGTGTMHGLYSGGMPPYVPGLGYGPTPIAVPDPGWTTPQPFTATFSSPRFVSDTVSYPGGGLVCQVADTLSADLSCYQCCGCPVPISRNYLVSTPLGTFTMTSTGDPELGLTAADDDNPLATSCVASDMDVGSTVSSHGDFSCIGGTLTSGASLPLTLRFYCALGTAIRSDTYPAGIVWHWAYNWTNGLPADCSVQGASATVSMDQSSFSCYPYKWTGTLAAGTVEVFGNTVLIPGCIVGDYSVTEAPCEYMELRRPVAAGPPDAARLARPAPARSPGGRVRVGIASVGAFLGGAERWISDLLDLCDPGAVEWQGVAYLDPTSGAPTFPTVVEDWLEHGPVAEGVDAIRDLAARSDVLVSWGLVTAELERVLAPGYPILQASHSALDLPWIHQMAGFPGSVSAAVSRAALRGLAPDRRDCSPVIRNAVSPSRVARTRTRAEMLRVWGLPRDAKVAGWLGRLAAEKRPEVFVDAVAALPEGWYGVMIGAGLQEAATRSYAARVAPGRVVFPAPILGPVGDALGAFDVHAMPTVSEACSLGSAETWLAGCPLVSTRVGLLEEQPGLARLIPNPPSGRDLAAAILADVADGEGTRARVEEARRFAATELSPWRFGREWTALILKVAARRGVLPPVDPAVRDRVMSCPDRGSVLPLSAQSDCGCGGGRELTECRAGRGKVPGRVTLRDCLACKA